MKELPNFVESLVDLAIKIQQIPAPTFHEGQRAAFIAQEFESISLCDVEINRSGNVYGRLVAPDASGGNAPLVISAHLDTVFPANTDLHLVRQEERLYGPGIGDNALAVACLVILPKLLREREIILTRDIWLVANTCEEGMGNLDGMKAVYKRFQERPKAYIILEGIGLGDIFHRGLAVTRYRITVDTPGGHSWTDYGSPSAIHELAKLVNVLTDLDLPNNPRTSLNIGVIAGGTSINTIASKAWFELDLRSELSTYLRNLALEIENLVMKANRTNIQVRAELVGQRPSGFISANHWLVRLAAECLAEQGIKPLLRIGSTDANIPLSQELPAICLGLTTGGRTHTHDEYINIPPLAQGIESLFQLIYRIT
jgi:tripeptide aminopeptidase